MSKGFGLIDEKSPTTSALNSTLKPRISKGIRSLGGLGIREKLSGSNLISKLRAKGFRKQKGL